MENFYKKASQLGHDVENLKKGEVFDHTIMVNNIDELKSLFHHNEPASIRSSRPSGVDESHHRTLAMKLAKKAQDYVFADSSLSDENLNHLKSSFPMAVRTVSLADKTLEPGLEHPPALL